MFPGDSAGEFPIEREVRARHSRRARRLLCAVLSIASASAIAQAADGFGEVFGGIEPIVHVRTYFWNSQDTSGAPSEAWALGGWAGLKTRWYADVFQLGVIGYTSQKIYGPADKGGSLLLAPGQDPINVLGQAYGSLRYAGQTFTGYRQLIDQPWVNPQDSRMIPNLFEGYLLSGKVAGLDYIGGYVTKIKTRDSDAFEWMSGAAGSKGPQRGMVLVGAQMPWADGANFRFAEQYLIDNYNTAYIDGIYPIAIAFDSRLKLRGQYANQQSVGSAGLGAFNTWMYGIGGDYEYGPATFQVAWTQTSHNKETQSAFGDNPSFLNMMQVAFNDANEKAWLIGGSLTFNSLGAPGLKASVAYGNGRGAIDSSTGAALGKPERDGRRRFPMGWTRRPDFADCHLARKVRG